MARRLTGVANETRVPAMRVKMELTIIEFETLGAAADGRGKTTRVDKAALGRLLRDHSLALGTLQDCHVEVQEDQI